jgi:hypothetical protein
MKSIKGRRWICFVLVDRGTGRDGLTEAASRAATEAGGKPPSSSSNQWMRGAPALLERFPLDLNRKGYRGFP